jgi:hypothetical protein
MVERPYLSVIGGAGSIVIFFFLKLNFVMVCESFKDL